jgi:FtsH-binding integral membrane protein
VTANRKLVHFVPIVCIAAQVVAFWLGYHHHLPKPAAFYAAIISTLAVVAGSAYAAKKASRWWITTLWTVFGVAELLFAIVLLAWTQD